MPKLHQVLTDREQAFSEEEKAQARANIGAAAAADAGIKTVSTDSTLTGDGTPGSVLGVADYTGLASKTWVQQQGYITAQGAELTAGRGIDITDHVISTPSATQMNYPLRVSESATVDRPVTSMMQYQYRGAINAIQQTTLNGPVDTLYAFNSVPSVGASVQGLGIDGLWHEVLTSVPADLTARSVTTYTGALDTNTTATMGINGFWYTAAYDEGGTGQCILTDRDCWVKHGDDGTTYSLTGLSTAVANKQDKLNAGVNIQIREEGSRGLVINNTMHTETYSHIIHIATLTQAGSTSTIYLGNWAIDISHDAILSWDDAASWLHCKITNTKYRGNDYAQSFCLVETQRYYIQEDPSYLRWTFFPAGNTLDLQGKPRSATSTLGGAMYEYTVRVDCGYFNTDWLELHIRPIFYSDTNAPASNACYVKVWAIYHYE